MARVVLTDRFVAGAKPSPSGRAEYFDAGTPGLTLRVSTGGRKAWSYFFTSPKDGRRARITIGAYPTTSLARARTTAIEAAGHIRDGEDPRTVFAAKEAGAITVAALCKSYLEKHAPNLRSGANIEQRLKKNVIPIIGPVRLADLHRRDINAVTDAIIRRKKPTEANRVFEVLRTMLNWAVKRGDLDRSPLERVKKPAAENGPRTRFLSDDEIAHLWRVLPDALAQSKPCQLILRLCLTTGQRVGEVSGMRVDELDFAKANWSLPASRTKNAHPHSVPLSGLAITIIRDAIEVAGEEAEFVFPSPATGDEDADASPEKSIHPHAVATTLRRAQKPTKERPLGRLGMKAWTSHSLRHTSLTGMAALGVTPHVIGAVANHRSVTKSSVTFQIYVHYSYEKEKRQALDLWAERLSAIIAGEAAKVIPMQREKAVGS